jgi:hypothetical protein
MAGEVQGRAKTGTSERLVSTKKKGVALIAQGRRGFDWDKPLLPHKQI